MLRTSSVAEPPQRPPGWRASLRQGLWMPVLLCLSSNCISAAKASEAKAEPDARPSPPPLMPWRRASGQGALR